jgi:hypothetical protein
VRLDNRHLDKYGFGKPFFWWMQGGVGKFGALAVLMFLGVGGVALALLIVAAKRGPRGIDLWSAPPSAQPATA